MSIYDVAKIATFGQDYWKKMISAFPNVFRALLSDNLKTLKSKLKQDIDDSNLFRVRAVQIKQIICPLCDDDKICSCTPEVEKGVHVILEDPFGEILQQVIPVLFGQLYEWHQDLFFNEFHDHLQVKSTLVSVQKHTHKLLVPAVEMFSF